MSRCDLDVWLLELELLQRLNSVQNLSEIECPSLSYWRFITFSPCNFRGGAFLPNGSQGCVDPTSNLARMRHIRSLFKRSDMLLHFQTPEAQSWEILKTTPNFALFDLLWNLGEGWARSLYQLLKLYLRPNLRNTFDGHPLRGCKARWIDKKEKKLSLWVKLKAFPTNVGRPNY